MERTGFFIESGWTVGVGGIVGCKVDCSKFVVAVVGCWKLLVAVSEGVLAEFSVAGLIGTDFDLLSFS